MKKNLLILTAILLSVGTVFTFSSCSDDDDNKKDNKIKDYITSYSGKTLVINGQEGASYQSAKITAASDDNKVNVSITGVYPEINEATFSDISVTENSDGTWYFEAQVTAENTYSDIYISGNLSMDGSTPVLNATTSRTIKSDVVNHWDVNPDGLISLDIYGDLNGDGEIDGQDEMYTTMISSMLTGMINPIVEARLEKLDLDFQEKGGLEISWTTMDGGISNLYAALADLIPVVTETMLRSMLSIEYYVTTDGTAMIAIDKGIFSLLDLVSGLIAEAGVDIDQIIALMTDLGGYYGLPLGYKVDGSELQFIADKAFITKVLPVVGEFIGDIQLGSFSLEDIAGIITLAERFDLIANFSK